MVLPSVKTTVIKGTFDLLPFSGDSLFSRVNLRAFPVRVPVPSNGIARTAAISSACVEKSLKSNKSLTSLLYRIAAN